MNRSAGVVLNIPQRKDWRWLSLMRIVAALRCGRATVSLGTQDESQIAACCHQLDIEDCRWPLALKELIDGWPFLYQTAQERYLAMAEEFESAHGFPHDMTEFWAITDCLCRPSEK
jgi:hypothetical protein